MGTIKEYVCSIGFAALIIGIVKFDTIYETFYTPYDLEKGREYINRLITLGGLDDGSCSAQAIQARNEARRINIVLNGVLEAHKNEHRYLSIIYTKEKMDMSQRSNNPLC